MYASCTDSFPHGTAQGVRKRLTSIVRPVYKNGMHLSDYMLLHNLNDEAVADGIGCTRATISRIRRRKSRPDWGTIEEIKKFTKGAVVADDFQNMESAQ